MNRPNSDVPGVAALKSIIDDNETVIGGFTSHNGVVRTNGGERTVVDQTVLTAVTDRRILLTIPESQRSGAVVLQYSEIASTSVDESTLSLTTMEGTGLEWRNAPSVPSGVARHLRWVGRVRSDIRSLANDVELAAGAIQTHADALEWEEGLDTYRNIRKKLDELLNDVFCTEAVPESVLAPAVTDLERTLETAHAHLFIERGRDRLELGSQLIDNADYEQGRKVLRQAQEDHERATALRDAVERADAFQFGTQRDLAADIESLEWQIETVAAEPIREAHEAKITAESTAKPAHAVEHWERAVRLYGHVLTLEWESDNHNFAADPDRIRQDLEYAAVQLIDHHSTLADESWNAGADKQESPKAALTSCLTAKEHLRRAHELAAEFAPDRSASIGSRLETVAETVSQMRCAEHSTEDPGAVADPAESAPVDRDNDSERDERTLPSAEDLVMMDTHHKITLDSKGLDVGTADHKCPAAPSDQGSQVETAEEGAAGEDSTGNEPRKH